jgi:hypothetical protein
MLTACIQLQFAGRTGDRNEKWVHRAAISFANRGHALVDVNKYARSTESVNLQSTAGRSAIVGGVVGYHATSSSKSSSRKWRNAAIGSAAMAGAKRSGEGDLTGVMYTVALVDGSQLNIISDQTQIVSGDCVTVEQVGDNANIRRADPVLCEPETQVLMPDLEGELVEEAEECYAAKQQLLAADSDQAAELASRKVRVLCNG